MPDNRIEPKTFTEGQITNSSGNNISGKQYTHPVNTHADILRNTVVQNAYFINILGAAYTTLNLTPFAKTHILDSYESAFRFHVQRDYGRIYPINGVKMPNTVGQPIVTTTSPHIPIFDDYTALNMFHITTQVDYELFKASEGYINSSDYSVYYRQHLSATGRSFALAFNTLSHMLFAAISPGVIMTQSCELLPFFDENAKPDEATSPAAKDGFDTTKNKFGSETVMKELVGQVQEKLTNVGYYNPRLYALDLERIEYVEPTKPDAPSKNATKGKNIYFLKHDDKQYNQKDLNRPFSLIALHAAIINKIKAMESIASPANMAFFKPFETGKRSEGQLSRTVNPKVLEVIMNPYDMVELAAGITTTSPYGNHRANLSNISDLVMSVYSEETMLPGHFVIMEHDLYRAIRILQNSGHMTFGFCNGEQGGTHLYGKVYICKFRAFYKGIPLAFVPSQECMNYHYSAFKIS